MGTWVVEIPDFLPTRLNTLMRRHWGRRSRMLSADKDLISVHVKMAGVPSASRLRRVHLRFESPRTPADPDGRLKASLDGLVACGALLDDSPNCVELGRVESVRGPRRKTVITLEEEDQV